MVPDFQSHWKIRDVLFLALGDDALRPKALGLDQLKSMSCSCPLPWGQLDLHKAGWPAVSEKHTECPAWSLLGTEHLGGISILVTIHTPSKHQLAICSFRQQIF
jgi:hypothetical protein